MLFNCKSKENNFHYHSTTSFTIVQRPIKRFFFIFSFSLSHCCVSSFLSCLLFDLLWPGFCHFMNCSLKNDFIALAWKIFNFFSCARAKPRKMAKLLVRKSQMQTLKLLLDTLQILKLFFVRLFCERRERFYWFFFILRLVSREEFIKWMEAWESWVCLVKPLNWMQACGTDKQFVCLLNVNLTFSTVTSFRNLWWSESCNFKNALFLNYCSNLNMMLSTDSKFWLIISDSVSTCSFFFSISYYRFCCHFLLFLWFSQKS